MKSARPIDAIAMAQVHFGRGEYAQAEAIYRELLELELPGSMNGRPVQLVLRERLIKALVQTDRHAEAVEELRKTWAYYPNHTDPEFDEIYLRALRKTRTSPLPQRRRFRLYQLIGYLGDTYGVPGAVAECGCFRGLSSYVLCSYLAIERDEFRGEDYHVFDSFSGLGEPQAEDAIPDDTENAAGLRSMAQSGAFAASRKWVESALAAFPAITYHAGWIPDTFRDLPELAYRFVHLDVDLHRPTLEALHYFYPRLSSGGVIVSDDYSWPGCRKAIDDFCAEVGTTPEVNSHKQAVIRKR